MKYEKCKDQIETDREREKEIWRTKETERREVQSFFLERKTEERDSQKDID